MIWESESVWQSTQIKRRINQRCPLVALGSLSRHGVIGFRTYSGGKQKENLFVPTGTARTDSLGPVAAFIKTHLPMVI